MNKNNIPLHWQEDEPQNPPEARHFVDVSWRLEMQGLPAPLRISKSLCDRLFPDLLSDCDFGEIDFPCQETAERFAEAALILSTAIAATERHSPVCVELPVIEGVTNSKTHLKVFSYRDDWTTDGYLILLVDEHDPTDLELAELEAEANCLDVFREWEDI